MKTKNLLLILFALFYSNANCQITIKFTTDYNYGISFFASIENIINTMNMPSSEFKTQLINKGYRFSEAKNDCYSYSYSKSIETQLNNIEKCGNHMLVIFWTNVNKYKSNIDAFIEEIEGLYVGIDNRVSVPLPVYNYIKDNYIYQIHISREPGTETIYCQRFIKPN